MTITTPVRPAPAPFRRTLRTRLAERRMLARRDRLTARLLELRDIAQLVAQAQAVIETGWLQRGWYRYLDEPAGSGHDQPPVVGACLVGSIVHAGGGRQAFPSQLVQRSLDLTWNTLYGVDGDSLAWCPPPAVRLHHVRDLTRWNDQPTRTRAEVLDLLAAAGAETGRLRQLIQAQPIPAG